jgi:hypothetical protein
MQSESELDPSVEAAQHVPDNFQLLQHFWDEYKYRHGKCWEVVYKVGGAVFALGAIPYAPPAKGLHYALLVSTPAALGTCLAMFGWVFACRELRLFDDSANTYIDLRERFVKDSLADDWKRLPFNAFMHFLMFALSILSCANIYVAWRWNCQV